MKGMLDEIQRWRDRGEDVALATVVAARRSAPRPVGSKLAISSSGLVVGSVSGGCVESDVCHNALEVLRDGEPRLLTYAIADDRALTVGLPCGGKITVFVERLHERTFQAWYELTASDDRVAILTIIAGPRIGAKLLVPEHGASLGDAPPELARLVVDVPRSRLVQEGGWTAFVEVRNRPLRLVIFGALDISEALCRAAHGLGWQTIVVEARKAVAIVDRVPSADKIVAEWPEEALTRIHPDADTAVLALTHDEKFDIPAIVRALQSDAFYIGALGSRSTQELRRSRLLELGVAASDLARLYGPCGLDIAGETAPETAISILSEILAVKAGRRGGHLCDSATPIHRPDTDNMGQRPVISLKANGSGIGSIDASDAGGQTGLVSVSASCLV